MHFKAIRFIGSYSDVGALPELDKPEFAFVGRSNVGKSSLINMLCNRKSLARTSATPGKTQTINLYGVDDLWVLADLPGYGFAKVAKSLRRGWPRMIEEYMAGRKELLCSFVLIDSRIPPQRIDLDLINMLGRSKLPFVMVFTKSDKVKQAELKGVLNAWRLSLSETWDAFPETIISSSITRKGRKQLLDAIEVLIAQKRPP
jgi:GTP-binding protein